MKFSTLIGIATAGSVALADASSTAPPSITASSTCNGSPTEITASCQSLLQTTVANKTARATYTSTYTLFINNDISTKPAPTNVKQSISVDGSGMYTVPPTPIPSIFKYQLCAIEGCDPKDDDAVADALSKGCSACGYTGAPTATVSTATVTDIEILPTTISDFYITASGINGTVYYLAELDPATSLLGYMTFSEKDTDAALFGLTTDQELRLESKGTTSKVLSGHDLLMFPANQSMSDLTTARFLFTTEQDHNEALTVIEGLAAFPCDAKEYAQAVCVTDNTKEMGGDGMMNLFILPVF